MALRDSLSWCNAALDSKKGDKARVLPKSRSRLQPRDEAIFLLHCAAEVEHALLVQYLYAGYSLRGDGDNQEEQDSLNRWRTAFFGIARQEMGRLATVQNLLGGPLTIEREDFPFRSGFCPFHFRRESLAKYLAAEMPELATLPSDRQRVMRYVIRRATNANRRSPVYRVGVLYDKLQMIFRKLADRDYRFDTIGRYPEVPGDRITGGGISSSLDEAVYIVKIIAGEEIAKQVQLVMQYFPDPLVTSHLPATPPICPLEGKIPVK